MNYDIKKIGEYLRIIIALLSLILMLMMFKGTLLTHIMNDVNNINDVKSAQEVLEETEKEALKNNNAKVSDVTNYDAQSQINDIFNENQKAVDMLNNICK